MANSEKSVTFHIDIDKEHIEKILNELTREGIPAVGTGHYIIAQNMQKGFIVVPTKYAERTSEIIDKYIP